jgi:cytochrome c oxidase assembly protein subunit 11
MSDQLQQKNRRMVLRLTILVAAMAGLSFASVPLYDMFCRVTGFGGTTQIAKLAPAADQVRERWITISFNADVNQNLPWEFRPEARSVKIKVGEVGETKFHAKNLSRTAQVGTSVYNVQPDKAGQYFNKVQCFCFEEHVLQSGETAEFPVTFFVDPDFADDPKMADVTDITLSYTFFLAKDQSKAQAATMAAQQHSTTGTAPATSLQ